MFYNYSKGLILFSFRLGWSDIGYSFVVGEDGNVYEARGWDTIGAHTKGYNSVGLGNNFVFNLSV